MEVQGSEQKRPLISVIVPIHNVAPYLRKCLDSLKNQTMKQIEVICIDDGSTDESGKIADEDESREWPIFRIIHTENRGLSAARNRGIDEAQADWLMFVDSDDWVHADYCEIPYEAAIENMADLVAFQFYEVTENERVKKQIRTLKSIELIDSEKAVDLNGPAVWRKMYRKELFNIIRFPEGIVFEDLAIMHKLLYSAERIISIPNRLYYHRFRTKSISHMFSEDSIRLTVSKQRYREITKYGYPEKKAKAQLVTEALRCCGRAECIESSLYEEAEKLLKDLDDIIPLFFGIIWIKSLLEKNKYKTIEHNIFIILIVMSWIGIISNIISGINSRPKDIILDMYSFWKMFLVFLGSYAFYQKHPESQKKCVNYISKIARIFILIGFLFGILNILGIADMSEGIRYGIKKYSFIYQNSCSKVYGNCCSHML